jgi:dihydrolipoamide dehydrogenase
MTETSFDIIVIGGGPGGYPAAIRASQLGRRVALVEEQHLGGICLNWGCIPTKALLHSAELVHLMGRCEEFGVTARDVQFDVAKLVKRSRKVSKRLTAGVKHLLKKNKVTVFDGRGRLEGSGAVRVTMVEGEEVLLSASSVILATGARARVLPGLEPDQNLVWTYREAMIPDSVPGSILIIGSGAIGMEFASFFRDMGSEVMVVEMLPQILPVEDSDIAAVAAKLFSRRGIELHTETTVTALDKGELQVTATLTSASGETQKRSFDKVILAVGVVGNVEDLGLEGTGVVVDRDHIVSNEWTETGEPDVYAIGDVAGPPWLAHKATHEGILCVERIAGVEGLHPLDPRRIPGCTYCRPQIASVGYTEAQAIEAGYEPRVGKFPFMGNGKAIAMGETEGMVKTIFDQRTGELLGAHLVGAEVTELIQGFAIAMELETTEAELMRVVFPHPSLSEMMHESVLAAYGRALHV